MLRTTLMLLALLVVGVSNAGEAGNCGCSKAGVKSRILDGTTVPASQFPTVGEVGDASGVFCTGTLIAPNAVLCAAHCVADDNGNQTLGDTQGRFTLGGVVYNTQKVIIHPSYRGFAGDDEGQTDLSILILTTNVPNVTPTPIYRKTPAAGMTLVLAGFGEQGTGSNGGNGTYPSGGNIVTGTTTIETVTNTFLKWTFNPGESDTAPGDSGGPAFIVEGGVRFLAGVTSGGTGSGFNNSSYDVRVDSFAAWIDSTLSASGSGTGGGGGTNTTLLLSGPSASANPVAPNTVVTFSAVGATSNVSFAWNFGDGSPADNSGGIVTHSYSENGSYTVTLTASNGTKTETYTLQMTVSQNNQPPVGGGGGGNFTQASARKKRFTVNFSAPERSRFDITLASEAFFHFDRFEFEDERLDTTVRVFIGGEEADTVEIIGTNSFGEFGDGKLSWNYRKGMIRYQLKGDAAAEFLIGAGVPDEDTEETVPVQFSLQVGGVQYGGTYNFSYKGREGFSGTGK